MNRRRFLQGVLATAALVFNPMHSDTKIVADTSASIYERFTSLYGPCIQAGKASGWAVLRLEGIKDEITWTR